MSKGDCLARRARMREPQNSPALPGIGPGTPPWGPEGVVYDNLDEKIRAMIAEIIEPR